MVSPHGDLFFTFGYRTWVVLEVVVDQEAVVAEVGEMAVVLFESKIAMIFLAQSNLLDFCHLIGLYND